MIEDTAWGCGGFYDNIPLGTYGSIGTFSFDFAKTITTGEGGMLVFKDEKLFKKAAAWHDHGHENNPSLPRWEDSRSGSGFNYRMMELQGAIGLAQLEKLDFVVEKQRSNMNLIKSEISNLDIQFREVPTGSFETADALVFFTKNNKMAIACRESLLANGVGTKILPEAISWHFAGLWEHMPSLNKDKQYEKSLSYLNRAVSIPITVNMDEKLPSKIKKALLSVLNS
jgi:8-amino-3,8-dideoxy-alpha-D-manno-octulosonate transaminase